MPVNVYARMYENTRKQLEDGTIDAATADGMCKLISAIRDRPPHEPRHAKAGDPDD